MKKLSTLILSGILGCLTMSIHANPIPVVTTRLIESFPIEMPDLLEYPIYINAFMDDEEGVDIDHVVVTVNGTEELVKESEGYFYVLWRPEEYGDYDVEITAVATNEESTTIERSVSVVEDRVTQTIRTMDEVVIEFNGDNSRWYYGTYELPQYVGAYNRVRAFMDIGCPSIPGGCDDWDRVAWIEIKGPDGNWIELIRYITPYGTGCDHIYEVTAFNSLLQGSVEFRMFIDTWGTGGWEITLDLEHRRGSPIYPYSRVDEIWDGSYSFGNPENLQPVPIVNYTMPGNAQKAKLRMTNTGHGWGQNNSFNAAEFFHAVHEIKVDGTVKDEHDLWWDCDPNPDGCTGQAGTWFYDRAGWCPGAIATAEVYEYVTLIGQGSFDLSYIFHESYVDNCHANNPSCVSGVTCNDCNDGFNPIYYVDAVMVTDGEVPLISDDYTAPPPLPTGIRNDYSNIYSLEIYPNPTSGRFKMEVSDNLLQASKVVIYDVSGQAHKVYYFDSASELTAYEFDISEVSTGNYFVKVQTMQGEGVLKIIRD